jgi:toxin ParE1/3/4
VSDKVVEFQAEAALEYEAAFEWYFERSQTVASRFASEVEFAIAGIGKNPQRWPEGVHGTRQFVLAHFPFALIYRELPSKIQRVAVAHGKRRPGYWKQCR